MPRCYKELLFQCTCYHASDHAVLMCPKLEFKTIKLPQWLSSGSSNGTERAVIPVVSLIVRSNDVYKLIFLLDTGLQFSLNNSKYVNNLKKNFTIKTVNTFQNISRIEHYDCLVDVTFPNGSQKKKNFTCAGLLLWMSDEI